MYAGNDFSTLYAPLIRDGRMEKYYWNPTREDRVGVCVGIFKDDNIVQGEVEVLVDTFPNQVRIFFLHFTNVKSIACAMSMSTTGG